jgi:xanthine dehydrogenase accessory factor
VSIYETLRDALRNAEPVALATIVSGPGVGAKLLIRPGVGPLGSLGHPDLDRVAGRDALAELEAGRSGTRHYGTHGETLTEDEPELETITVFIESFAPPPTMVIFGAVDFTAALGKVAKVLGYRVVVCDARKVFATRQRFPMADEVIVDWPDRVLDRLGPGLGRALKTNVGYIGVMGSRKTHAKRMERLAEAGVTSPTEVERVMAPIGLDLGARTPEETAVSICAEIISRRTGRATPSLRAGAGPIH